MANYKFPSPEHFNYFRTNTPSIHQITENERPSAQAIAQFIVQSDPHDSRTKELLASFSNYQDSLTAAASLRRIQEGFALGHQEMPVNPHDMEAILRTSLRAQHESPEPLRPVHKKISLMPGFTGKPQSFEPSLVSAAMEQLTPGVRTIEGARQLVQRSEDKRVTYIVRTSDAGLGSVKGTMAHKVDRAQLATSILIYRHVKGEASLDIAIVRWWETDPLLANNEVFDLRKPLAVAGLEHPSIIYHPVYYNETEEIWAWAHPAFEEPTVVMTTAQLPAVQWHVSEPRRIDFLDHTKNIPNPPRSAPVSAPTELKHAGYGTHVLSPHHLDNLIAEKHFASFYFTRLDEDTRVDCLLLSVDQELQDFVLLMRGKDGLWKFTYLRHELVSGLTSAILKTLASTDSLQIENIQVCDALNDLFDIANALDPVLHATKDKPYVIEGGSEIYSSAKNSFWATDGVLHFDVTTKEYPVGATFRARLPESLERFFGAIPTVRINPPADHKPQTWSDYPFLSPLWLDDLRAKGHPGTITILDGAEKIPAILMQVSGTMESPAILLTDRSKFRAATKLMISPIITATQPSPQWTSACDLILSALQSGQTEVTIPNFVQLIRSHEGILNLGPILEKGFSGTAETVLWELHDTDELTMKLGHINLQLTVPDDPFGRLVNTEEAPRLDLEDGPLTSAFFEALPDSHPMVFTLLVKQEPFKAVYLPLLSEQDQPFAFFALRARGGIWRLVFALDDDGLVRQNIRLALTSAQTKLVASPPIKGFKNFMNLDAVHTEEFRQGIDKSRAFVYKHFGWNIACRLIVDKKIVTEFIIVLPNYPFFGPRLLSTHWFESFPAGHVALDSLVLEEGRLLRLVLLRRKDHPEQKSLIAQASNGSLHLASPTEERRSYRSEAELRTAIDAEIAEGGVVKLIDEGISLHELIMKGRVKFPASKFASYAQLTGQEIIIGHDCENAGHPPCDYARAIFEIPGTKDAKLFDFNPVTNPTTFGTRDWFIQYTANPLNKGVLRDGEKYFVVLQSNEITAQGKRVLFNFTLGRNGDLLGSFVGTDHRHESTLLNYHFWTQRLAEAHQVTVPNPGVRFPFLQELEESSLPWEFVRLSTPNGDEPTFNFSAIKPGQEFLGFEKLLLGDGEITLQLKHRRISFSDQRVKNTAKLPAPAPAFVPPLLSRAWFESFPEDDPRVYFADLGKGLRQRCLLLDSDDKEHPQALITYNHEGQMIFLPNYILEFGTENSLSEKKRKIFSKRSSKALFTTVIPKLGIALHGARKNSHYVQSTGDTIHFSATLINNGIRLDYSPRADEPGLSSFYPLPASPAEWSTPAIPPKFGSREWFIRYTAEPQNRPVLTNGEWRYVVLESQTTGNLMMISLLPDGQLTLFFVPDHGFKDSSWFGDKIREALLQPDVELGQIPEPRRDKNKYGDVLNLFMVDGVNAQVQVVPLRDGGKYCLASDIKSRLTILEHGLRFSSKGKDDEDFIIPAKTQPVLPTMQAEPIAPPTLPMYEGPIDLKLLNALPETHPMTFSIEHEGTLYRAIYVTCVKGPAPCYGLFVERSKNNWLFSVNSKENAPGLEDRLKAILKTPTDKILRANRENNYFTKTPNFKLADMLAPGGVKLAILGDVSGLRYQIKGNEVIVSKVSQGVDTQFEVLAIPAFNIFDPLAHPINNPVPAVTKEWFVRYTANPYNPNIAINGSARFIVLPERNQQADNPCYIVLTLSASGELVYGMLRYHPLHTERFRQGTKFLISFFKKALTHRGQSYGLIAQERFPPMEANFIYPSLCCLISVFDGGSTDVACTFFPLVNEAADGDWTIEKSSGALNFFSNHLETTGANELTFDLPGMVPALKPALAPPIQTTISEPPRLDISPITEALITLQNIRPSLEHITIEGLKNNTLLVSPMTLMIGPLPLTLKIISSGKFRDFGRFRHQKANGLVGSIEIQWGPQSDPMKFTLSGGAGLFTLTALDTRYAGTYQLRCDNGTPQLSLDKSSPLLRWLDEGLFGPSLDIKWQEHAGQFTLAISKSEHIIIPSPLRGEGQGEGENNQTRLQPTTIEEVAAIKSALEELTIIYLASINLPRELSYQQPAATYEWQEWEESRLTPRSDPVLIRGKSKIGKADGTVLETIIVDVTYAGKKIAKRLTEFPHILPVTTDLQGDYEQESFMLTLNKREAVISNFLLTWSQRIPLAQRDTHGIDTASLQISGQTQLSADGISTVKISELVFGARKIGPVMEFPARLKFAHELDGNKSGWENFQLELSVQDGKVIATISDYVFIARDQRTRTVLVTPSLTQAASRGTALADALSGSQAPAGMALEDPLRLKLTLEFPLEGGVLLQSATLLGDMYVLDSKSVTRPPTPSPQGRGSINIEFPPPLRGGGQGAGEIFGELAFIVPKIGRLVYVLESKCVTLPPAPSHQGRGSIGESIGESRSVMDELVIRATRPTVELAWDIEIAGDRATLTGLSALDEVYEFPLEVRDLADRNRYLLTDKTALYFLHALHKIAGQAWAFDPAKHQALEIVTLGRKFMELIPLTLTKSGLRVTSVAFSDIRVLRQLVNPARVVAAASDFEISLGDQREALHPNEIIQWPYGETFVTTERTLAMIQNHIVIGDNGPVFTFVDNAPYEYEMLAMDTGKVLVLPVRWSAGRATQSLSDLPADQVTRGAGGPRATNPFVLRSREHLLIYDKAQARSTAQPLDSTSLRVYDQGGKWVIYALGNRHAHLEVGPKGEHGIMDWRLSAVVSPINPTIIGLVNVIDPDGSMDQSAAHRKRARKVIEREVVASLTRDKNALPELSYARSRLRLPAGQPHELIFYSRSAENNLWAKLTGISVLLDKGYLKFSEQLILTFGRNETVLTQISVLAMEPEDGQRGNLILMQILDNHELKHLFRMDLDTGELLPIAKENQNNIPRPAGVDFAEVLRSKNLPVLDEATRAAYRRKAQNVAPELLAEVHPDIPPLPEPLLGFRYPSQIQETQDPQLIAKLVSNLQGHIFLPEEKSLFDQLLIGRKQETFLFIATNGAILIVPMLLDENRSRFIPDLSANPVWSLKGTRLLLPDPHDGSLYYDVLPRIHPKTDPQSTILELSVGPDNLSINLKQVLSWRTVNNSAGRPAFGFYPEYEAMEVDALHTKLVRLLQEWIEYNYLESVSSAIPSATVSSLGLKLSVTPKKVSLPLNDDTILHSLDGIEFDRNADGAVSRARINNLDLHVPEDRGALYFLSDLRGQPILVDSENAGLVLRFVIQDNGELLFTKRRSGLRHFISAPESVGFEMIDNEGEQYPGGAQSSARLLQLANTAVGASTNDATNYEIRAALGRWEGATGSGLQFLGKEAQVKFNITVTTDGSIKVDPQGFIKEESSGHAREKEKQFHPAQVELIPDFNGHVRVYLRESGNPSNFAWLEFDSPQNLTNPQTFAVSLAHYNRRNARLNKLPSEAGFLSASLRHDPIDIGLMHFLKATIPGDELTQLKVGDGSYAQYALLQGVLDTLGFTPGHAFWSLALRSLLELVATDQLPEWTKAIDEEALRARFAIPLLPTREPDPSLLEFLNDQRLLDSLPNGIIQALRLGRINDLSDLTAYVEKNFDPAEQESIWSALRPLHLWLASHESNVQESRYSFPTSTAMITALTRQLDATTQFSNHTIRSALFKKMDGMVEHFALGRIPLAILANVAIHNPDHTVSLVKNMDELPAPSPEQTPQARQLFRTLFAHSVTHAQLIQPWIRILNRFSASVLYDLMFARLTKAFKQLAEWPTDLAVRALRQIQGKTMDPRMIVHLIDILSLIEDATGAKRDFLNAKITPALQNYLGKKWSDKGSDQVKSIFRARVLVSFITRKMGPAQARELADILAQFPDYVQRAKQDPSSIQLPHNVRISRRGQKLQDATGYEDEVDLGMEAVEPRPEPLVDPIKRDLAFKHLREATETLAGHDFTTALAQAGTALKIFLDLELGDEIDRARNFIAHIHLREGNRRLEALKARYDQARAENDIELWTQVRNDHQAGLQAYLSALAIYDRAHQGHTVQGLILSLAKAHNILARSLDEKRKSPAELTVLIAQYQRDLALYLPDRDKARQHGVTEHTRMIYFEVAQKILGKEAYNLAQDKQASVDKPLFTKSAGNSTVWLQFATEYSEHVAQDCQRLLGLTPPAVITVQNEAWIALFHRDDALWAAFINPEGTKVVKRVKVADINREQYRSAETQFMGERLTLERLHSVPPQKQNGNEPDTIRVQPPTNCDSPTRPITKAQARTATMMIQTSQPLAIKNLPPFVKGGRGDFLKGHTPPPRLTLRASKTPPSRLHSPRPPSHFPRQLRPLRPLRPL